MGKTILYTLKGAAIGAGGAVCLFIAGFFIELLNLGCAILTCDCDKPMVFDWSGMWGLLLICVIGGAIIGLFYGIYKAKEESDAETARKNAEASEEARKQRVRWAGEVKQKALNVNNTCSGNKSSNKPLVSTTYKSAAQMTDILNELTTVTEKQGRIDSLAEELSKKGGASV